MAKTHVCRRHPRLQLRQSSDGLLLAEPARLHSVRRLATAGLYSKSVTFQGSTPPPAEAEERSYAVLNDTHITALFEPNSPRHPGPVQILISPSR